MLHAGFVVGLAVIARQDTLVALVRAAAEREPVEVFKVLKTPMRVRGIQLLDVDGDGTPEAFVWIDPSFRQTPTILVYTFDPAGQPRRLLEGLVPGRLRPVSGRYTDDHTLGFGFDLSVVGDVKRGDIDKMIANAVTHRMSLVSYRTFFHADAREGFVGFVDLFDRALPAPDTRTCASFEFSAIEGVAAGTLSGNASHYLVALTDADITIYRFHGIRANGTLDKDVWLRPRPVGATGISVSPTGEVAVTMADGRAVPLPAP
jgi:hypothetical protein